MKYQIKLSIVLSMISKILMTRNLAETINEKYDGEYEI